MNNAQKLKAERDLLLKLHKVLVDRERAAYEGIHGPLTSGGFLNVLLEDQDFSWLRKFSMLIVEIDEMFAQKDGLNAEMVDANLTMVEELVEMREADEYFRARYSLAIQNSSEAAGLHSELKALLSEPAA